MTKFEEEFDEKVEIFDVIGNHNSMCCEVDQVKEVFKDWQPQQALPVVPECVGDYISGMKENGENIAFAIMCNIYNVAGEGNAKAIHWKDSNPEDFARAWLDGYTVEKSQLFYLKHIDMSKADKECDWYLITDCVKLCHEWVGKNLKPKDDDFKFTQSEIDSMETGSYEQIEVTE